MRGEVVFYVNGVKRRVSGLAAFNPLSSYLRYDLGLTGTKIVCSEGDCGACTVLIDRPVAGGRAESNESGGSDESRARFRALNSCILPVGLIDGANVVTVEALAAPASGPKPEEDLSEVQAQIVKHQGGQCGFCTPGFVMALTAMFEENPKAAAGAGAEKRVKNHLTGNLCRCTGYAPIIEAALAVDPARFVSVAERFGHASVTRDLLDECREPFRVEDRGRDFFGPRALAEAVRIRGEVKNLRVFGSATDLGVQLNKGRFELESALSLNGISELTEIAVQGGHIVVGARASLADLERFMERHEPDFARFLRIFASPQIKNAATLSGNIVNASPIADTVPYLVAVEAELELAGSSGMRRVPINRFYQGYKKMDLAPGELLVRVRIPIPRGPGRFLTLFKVSQRRDLDISAVNACFEGSVGENGWVGDGAFTFQRIRICYGGVGPTAIRLPKTEAFLLGKRLDASVIDAASALIRGEIAPISDARGSREFRLKIAENLFRKFCAELIAGNRGDADWDSTANAPVASPGASRVISPATSKEAPE